MSTVILELTCPVCYGNIVDFEAKVGRDEGPIELFELETIPTDLVPHFIGKQGICSDCQSIMEIVEIPAATYRIVKQGENQL